MNMRIAVPCDGPQLAAHFGHASRFAMFDVDREKGEITGEMNMDAPPHQPGLLPAWLSERGANVVLAGGMGGRARELFSQYAITVVVGVQEPDPRTAVEHYLKDNLSTTSNPCDH